MEERLPKITIPSNDFEIILAKNTKILFSGIFGSGKTTFLNDFFLKNHDYESIHLYPVNYSVTSDEDIFELIKYDILFQLIGKFSEEEFEKIDIPYHLTLWSYFVNTNDLGKKFDFFSSFLTFAGEHGNAFLRIYDQFKILKNGFEKYHKKNQQDDYEAAKKKLKNVEHQPGHIYEEDFYTKLIRNLLKKLKQNGDEERQTVLIIDDLDRLDPDHIFRLLNIFSAHMDFKGIENENKFDFNRVILVCDYNNIENVFIHRYGPFADFGGYIDKFYNSVYWFNPSEYINKYIGKYLKEIDVSVSYEFFTPNHNIGGHIRYIIENLIMYKLLNFRELLAFGKAYDLMSARNLIIKKSIFDNTLLKRFNFNAVTIVHFLLVFFDNESSLL